MQEATTPTQPAANNPAASADENSGKIARPQVTDRNMREKDLPRGSEPETRGSSRER